MSLASNAAPVKIAFVGDQGVGEDARSVLSLIASEGTDLLLIQGDLGYSENSAAAWEENLTNALGADFPVLTVVGNHENYEWPLYQNYIQSRIDRASALSCTGESGVKALCQYENIEIVQVSPGITEVPGVKPEDNYADFIASSFADSTAHWRICSWHKNQSKLQTGSKSDATGWEVYDACLDAGAMIALAHEHAYSRTHLLSDFENQTVVHKNDEMTLESGKTFAFVSGLGGREVREQRQGGDWWASIYTATQGATHGALFCTFDNLTADCYFKAIDGAVPDQFSLRVNTIAVQSSEGEAALTSLAEAETQPTVEVVQPETDNQTLTEEFPTDITASEDDSSLSGNIASESSLVTFVADATTPVTQAQQAPEAALETFNPPPRNTGQTASTPLAAAPTDNLNTTASGAGHFSLVFLVFLLSQIAVHRIANGNKSAVEK